MTTSHSKFKLKLKFKFKFKLKLKIKLNHKNESQLLVSTHPTVYIMWMLLAIRPSHSLLRCCGLAPGHCCRAFLAVSRFSFRPFTGRLFKRTLHTERRRVSDCDDQPSSSEIQSWK